MAKIALIAWVPDEVLEPIVRSASQAPLLNIGCGEDLTVCELAELIRGVVQFEGRLIFHPSKPDGTTRKLLDVSRMKKLGWKATIPVVHGLTEVYEDGLKSFGDLANKGI